MSKVELSVRLRKLRDGKDGADGKSPFVAVVSPAAISYTAGVEKTIKMSFKIVQGDTSYDVATATPQYGASQSTPLGVEYSTANKKLTFRSTATWEGIITFSLVYNGVTYASAVVVSKVSNGANGKDGATGPQGDPGPAGLVYRKTEWAAGVEFRNDKLKLESGAPASESQNGDGVWYLDIVTKTDSNGKLKGVWECYSSHTSSAETDPEKESYDGDHSAHWRKFSSLGNQPIYTSLVVAEGAVIGFMQGNQLKIFDLAGNLKAGISAASGAYPIFYANPQIYPVSVAVSMAATSSSSTSSQSVIWISTTATVSVSVAANNYLCFRFIVTYSDGSTKTEYRYGSSGWKNGTGSTVTITPKAVVSQFVAVPTSNWPSSGLTERWDKPCTTAGNPYLRIFLKLTSSVTAGPYSIGKQTAGAASGEATLDAMYQQREDGSASFGMPDGARILLNAAPSSGLPRMEVFDPDGELAAQFDGSRIYDSGELYGTGQSSATLEGTDTLSVSTDSSLGAAVAQSVSNSRSVSIDCSTDATIVIPECTIKVWGSCGTKPSASQSGMILSSQTALARIMVDNFTVAYAKCEFTTDGQSVSESSAVTVSTPKRSVAVSKGAHQVTIRVEYTGYKTGSASAKLNTDLSISLVYGKLMARYFANGLAIGSATNNYFMAWDNNGTMNFVIRNANHGLKVDADGTSILKDGQWKNLESLFS